MRIFYEIQQLRDYLEIKRREGKSIGFVPTMGFLHRGHLSLIKQSVHDNDMTVLSIYVNPTQFSLNEDLDKYPRDLENDQILANEAGADIIFIPTNETMYSKDYSTYVNVEGLTDNLCGTSRPTHFQGVTTIVTKLFNIVQPHKAYFGQKDAQQAIVIKQMVKDLNIPIDIIVCPIIREKDGLAMSSRNSYLSNKERNSATVLYQSLLKAKSYIEAGETSVVRIKDQMLKIINERPNVNIEYIKIVNENTLRDINIIQGNILIALAAKVGQTRLIDNINMEVH